VLTGRPQCGHWKRLRKLDSSEDAALGCRRSPSPELAMDDVTSAALSPSSVPNAPSRCDVVDCSVCAAQDTVHGLSAGASWGQNRVDVRLVLLG